MDALGGKTTIIHFNSNAAYNYLVENGDVFTLRRHYSRWYFGKKPSAQYARVLRFGNDTGIVVLKVFSGTYSQIGKEDLVPVKPVYAPIGAFVGRSGFENVKEWIHEAERLSGINEFWDLFHCRRKVELEG